MHVVHVAKGVLALSTFVYLCCSSIAMHLLWSTMQLHFFSLGFLIPNFQMYLFFSRVFHFFCVLWCWGGHFISNHIICSDKWALATMLCTKIFNQSTCELLWVKISLERCIEKVFKIDCEASTWYERCLCFTATTFNSFTTQCGGETRILCLLIKKKQFQFQNGSSDQQSPFLGVVFYIK